MTFALPAPWGKRGWKTFYTVLKGMVLYFLKVMLGSCFGAGGVGSGGQCHGVGGAGRGLGSAMGLEAWGEQPLRV